MKNLSLVKLLVLGVLGCQLVGAAYNNQMSLNKMFNYQGPLPIKDDRNGEIIKENLEEPETIAPAEDSSKAEAECWKLINERSVVTFALQRRVLDELATEMKTLDLNSKLHEAIEKSTSGLRKNMDEALAALEKGSAEEYFDSLFGTTEDIIHLSTLLRDPQLSNDVFLTLVKAVSHLGRNSSALIQEFSDMCSLVHKDTKSRMLSIFGLN